MFLISNVLTVSETEYVTWQIVVLLPHTRDRVNDHDISCTAIVKVSKISGTGDSGLSFAVSVSTHLRSLSLHESLPQAFA